MSEEKSQKITSFEDLLAWQKAYELALEIYGVTGAFPKDEAFGLVSQLRRASVSVASNIAEGFGRKTPKEKLRFYRIATGSLTEIKSQILIAGGVGFISPEEKRKLCASIDSTHRLLHGLITTTRSWN